MDLEKTINLIVDDLQKNAMPYETYVYDVKFTHQIIRKHLTEQLRLHGVSNRRELLKFMNWLDDEDDFKQEPCINECIVDKYLKL